MSWSISLKNGSVYIYFDPSQWKLCTAISVLVHLNEKWFCLYLFWSISMKNGSVCICICFGPSQWKNGSVYICLDPSHWKIFLCLYLFWPISMKNMSVYICFCPSQYRIVLSLSVLVLLNENYVCLSMYPSIIICLGISLKTSWFCLYISVLVHLNENASVHLCLSQFHETFVCLYLSWSVLRCF